MTRFIDQFSNIKARKHLLKNDLDNSETKTKCLIQFLQKPTFEKICKKNISNLHVKSLDAIIHKNNNDENETNNFDSIINSCVNINDGLFENYSTITIGDKFECLNLVFQYEKVKNYISNDIHPCDVPAFSKILDCLRKYDVIWFTIEEDENKQTEEENETENKDLKYIVMYILTHIFTVNTDKQYFLVHKSLDVLNQALNLCKIYFHTSNYDNRHHHDNYNKYMTEIYNDYIINSMVKNKIGGTKIGQILKKQNIRNVTEYHMPTTRKLLNIILQKCIDSKNNSLQNIEEFQNTLQYLRLYCMVDPDKKFTPVAPIQLHHIKDINFTCSDENIEISCSSHCDVCERLIPLQFVEKAPQNIINIVFTDLFKKAKNYEKYIKISFHNLNICKNKKLYKILLYTMKRILRVCNGDNVSSGDEYTSYIFLRNHNSKIKEDNFLFEETPEEEEEEEKEEEEEEEKVEKTNPIVKKRKKRSRDKNNTSVRKKPKKEKAIQS